MAYNKYLPRVSSIVSFVYPFEGKDKEGYLNWLYSKGLSEQQYMDIANGGGTFIHEQMENYLLGRKIKKNAPYNDYVEKGIELIKDMKIKGLESELFVSGEWYQGTIDLIAEYKGEKWIMDFKTYGLAKEYFGLGGRKQKPTDKLKKAELQLSLYSELVGIDNIAVIEITKEKAYFHKLEKINSKKIKEIVKDYWSNTYNF